MRHSVKLLFNTIASFAKIVVTAVTTIFATRIALEQLGVSDFGLFNLVSGIIVMLSFFSGALSISGQRYFSIAIGEKNNQKLNNYYNSSFGIHLVVGIGLVLLLFIASPFLFDGFLKISESQKTPAIRVYEILIASSFITIISIPFSAMINAYEDLGVLALADILSSIFKLIGAYSLLFFSDKLVTYALFMFGAVGLKSLIEYLWCLYKYKLLRIDIRRFYNFAIWKDMFGFVSWNTLGSLAVVIRNQGIAVLLNIYFGTIANAAYGVANQVNSLILSFASALTTVFAPTIIQSYGAGNLNQTRFTAVLSSKMSFLLSSMLALPIIVFLKPILKIWLGDVPQGTEIFTLFVILSFLLLQLYPGLNRAIYATGKIKNYQLWISVLLISVIPIGAILYMGGCPEYSVLIVLIISQFFTLVVTVSTSRRLLNLNQSAFWIKSVASPVLIFIVALSVGEVLSYYFQIKSILPIIIYSPILIGVYAFCYYHFILDHAEKSKFSALTNHIRSKINL